jgi:hypothetical protein
VHKSWARRSKEYAPRVAVRVARPHEGLMSKERADSESLSYMRTQRHGARKIEQRA